MYNYNDNVKGACIALLTFFYDTGLQKVENVI